MEVNISIIITATGHMSYRLRISDSNEDEGNHCVTFWLTDPGLDFAKLNRLAESFKQLACDNKEVLKATT